MGMRKATVAGAPVAVLLFMFAASRGNQGSGSSGYQSYAKYQGEEDSQKRAVELGVGEATLAGPREVVVDAHAELALRFTVGKAGMKTGGGIRLATAHGMNTDWGGWALQTQSPPAENYLTFRTSTGAALKWTAHTKTMNPLFDRYFPWQFVNEFILTGPELKPGDYIEIKLGDRGSGSPGVRMQRWDETAFELRFYVDPSGAGDFLLLPRNPSIAIVAAAAKELQVIAPSDWEAGKPGWINVWADDGFGNPAASYRGTVTFDAGSEAGRLPQAYTFQSGDRGAHRFENVSFPKEGVFRVRATDRDGKLSAESNPIAVRRAAPKEHLYWGDIHTHTMYSDGRGSPAETYDFGKRISALDYCAVSDHAFIVTDRMWQEIKEVTSRYNEPGRYVTFLAYEWSGRTEVGGDHNVYTSEPDMPLIRCYLSYNYNNLRMYHGPNKGANHVEDLFRMLAERFRNENLLVIPHFGGRPGNPEWHNPALQRSIEIFSDHRRSEDWTNSFLKRGYRVGIMASTDNHAGNAGYGVRRREAVVGEEGEVFSRVSPAERGTSLVAAYAPALTREAVFQAIYHRRTYATTGSRIILRFELNGLPMGSEGRVSGPPRIVVEAEGTAPIEKLRIVKNGRVVHTAGDGGTSAKLEYTDTSGDYSEKFYYIDLVQTDGEKAISSPVWINYDGKRP